MKRDAKKCYDAAKDDVFCSIVVYVESCAHLRNIYSVSVFFLVVCLVYSHVDSNRVSPVFECLPSFTLTPSVLENRYNFLVLVFLSALFFHILSLSMFSKTLLVCSSLPLFVVSEKAGDPFTSNQGSRLEEILVIKTSLLDASPKHEMQTTMNPISKYKGSRCR